jgi:glycosyltransferase involved in cell wall biosynthesis
MKSTRAKKILFVVTKSNWGGAQRYVYDLATHTAQVHEVVVALGGTGAQGAEPGSLKDKLEESGIRTIVIPHFMRDMSLLDDMHAFFELWRVVRTERPDVLHVTSSKAGGLGAFVGRLHNLLYGRTRTEGGATSFSGTRIVFTSHGLTFDESWRPKWQRVLIYCFTWLTIFLSHATIQISQDTFARARRMPFVGKKVSLVYNGIEEPEFLSRKESRHALLPELDEKEDTPPWIGSIAEYHPNKNLTTLIEAVALLHQQGTNVRLVLIGEEGDGRAVLEDTIRTHHLTHHVHLLGRVTHASRYLRALDVFVLPSKKEGLPYVLMEAGLAELPVVVSDISGNREIVTHGTSGIVVIPSAEELARALSIVLENPTLRAQYGSALRKDVCDRFSVERMVKDTLAVYE